MALSRIIFLLLSSVLLFTSACSYNSLHRAKTSSTQTLTSALIKPVIPEDRTSVKYKAEIDVLSKHFTGIIVLKQTDETTKHLVFVTELGMRMFDFVIKGDSVKADFVFDALNKPKFVNALTTNFRDILLISALQKNAETKKNKMGEYYWVHDAQNSIAIWKDERTFVKQVKIFSGKKKRAAINYINDYNNIKFKQSGLVKIRIELTRLIKKQK
jgi:hypothetical protein